MPKTGTSQIEINKPNNDGWTLLHLTARRGKIMSVNKCIELGADVNRFTKDEYCFSPLILAILGGHLTIVDLLLAHKADPNLVGKQGLNTPLMVAMQHKTNAFEMCKSLIKAGADVSMFAGGKMAMVCQRLGMNNALSEALVDLIENGPIISYQEMISSLLDNVDNTTVIKFFQDERIPVEKKYSTNLVAIARLRQTPGHFTLIVELIKAGYDLNKPDKDGSYPIHYTMYDEKTDGLILMLLLGNGAKPDVRNKEMKTPSEIAIEKGRYNSLNLLMENGANANIPSCDGLPLLSKIIQSEENMAEMFEVLIRHFVDISIYSEEKMEQEAGVTIDFASAELMRAARLADSVFELHEGEEFSREEFTKIKQSYTPEFINMFGTRLNAAIKFIERNEKVDLSKEDKLLTQVKLAKELIESIDWEPTEVFALELEIAKGVPWGKLKDYEPQITFEIIKIYIEQKCMRNSEDMVHNNAESVEEPNNFAQKNTDDETELAGNSEQTDWA